MKESSTPPSAAGEDTARSMTYGSVQVLRRPRGVRPRDRQLPKKADPSRVVAILVGSNYQVAAQLWLHRGFEFNSRVVVDTGSSASLIRKELLPDEVTVGPVDPSRWHMFDINGGLLPIVGSVTMHVCIGSYRTTVTFGVVPRMSVPVLLGTDFTDVHVPAIRGPKGTIKLRNGESVPILHRGKTVASSLRDVEAATHEAEGVSATLCLARGVVLPPRSRGYVLVTTNFKGNGLVSPIDRVYYKHQVQVAPGPMTCGDDKHPWRVEVLNTSNKARRLPARMKIASVSTYEGSITAVTDEQWSGLDKPTSPTPSPKSAEKTPQVY